MSSPGQGLVQSWSPWALLVSMQSLSTGMLTKLLGTWFVNHLQLSKWDVGTGLINRLQITSSDSALGGLVGWIQGLLASGSQSLEAGAPPSAVSIYLLGWTHLLWRGHPNLCTLSGTHLASWRWLARQSQLQDSFAQVFKLYGSQTSAFHENF